MATNVLILFCMFPAVNSYKYFNSTRIFMSSCPATTLFYLVTEYFYNVVERPLIVSPILIEIPIERIIAYLC